LKNRPPIYLVVAVTLLLLILSAVTVWAKPPEIGLRWTVPTFTPTPTPNTGVICVQAYHDRNRDRVRQPLVEELVTGAELEVSNLSHSLVFSSVTTSDQIPLCFTDLEPDTYIVRERNPQGYHSTTEDIWGAVVRANFTVSVPFGNSALVDAPFISLPLLLQDFQER
jgi:hypothetical protein